MTDDEIVLFIEKAKKKKFEVTPKEIAYVMLYKSTHSKVNIPAWLYYMASRFCFDAEWYR